MWRKLIFNFKLQLKLKITSFSYNYNFIDNKIMIDLTEIGLLRFLHYFCTHQIFLHIWGLYKRSSKALELSEINAQTAHWTR